MFFSRSLSHNERPYAPEYSLFVQETERRSKKCLQKEAFHDPFLMDPILLPKIRTRCKVKPKIVLHGYSRKLAGSSEALFSDRT